MSAAPMPSNDPAPLTHGVLVLAGYGIRLAVERGHLVAEDGISDQRRRHRFSRVDVDLKRVVVVGQSGLVTLDAIAWLQGVGVPLIHLDYRGTLLFVSSPSALPYAQIRRAQALAGESQIGLRISRDLLASKLGGQLEVLGQVEGSDRSQQQIHELLDAVAGAPTLKALQDTEARAARAYWRAWRDVSVRFEPKDARRRPWHWRTFGSRASVLGGVSPRRAVNPANAVLNYLYAIVEAETTIAAQAVRLDPMMGFLHRDRLERPSLACDLMEPVRPVVDAFALSLFRNRTFTKEDVFERHDGECRLMPSVTRELAATAGLWAERVYPVADYVAACLFDHRKPRANIVPGIPVPKAGLRRKPRSRTGVARGFEPLPDPRWEAFVAPAPSWSGMRGFQRVKAADRAWGSRKDADPAHFRTVILPKLQGLPLRQLAVVTGMSTTTCSLIRRGRQVPHPRHWQPLLDLATQAAADGGRE
jgi:CRISPR-associated endonuclease Cas1